MRKKEENPMGGEVHPSPSHGIRPSSHPIPWDNNFFKSVPWDGMGWDGMGWDGMGLSHPIRSPGVDNILKTFFIRF
jgi:hypothetical protein